MLFLTCQVPETFLHDFTPAVDVGKWVRYHTIPLDSLLKVASSCSQWQPNGNPCDVSTQVSNSKILLKNAHSVFCQLNAGVKIYNQNK